jgi:hypothetical protein
MPNDINAVGEGILPVVWKAKLPKSESYPLGAKEISEALKGVPQWCALTIHFNRYHVPKKRRQHWSVPSGERPLFHCSYSRFPASIHRDAGSPQWEISVYSVERPRRHLFNERLIDQGLPRIKTWLAKRSDLRDTFCVDGVDIRWDEEKEQLVFKEFFQSN